MWLVWLFACTGTEVGESAETGPCADAPVVTYETFGAGFLRENCQSCHAATSPDRKDAPEDVVFDTVDQVWAISDRILARAAIDEPTMPPLGGTTADDRARLEIWLTCADSGT
ncbi:MAG: hypothetical protein Q8P41_22635 [Pseudomonadota bacterium]|nr:hypothetical protein [Pseudomonadota bacterium]